MKKSNNVISSILILFLSVLTVIGIVFIANRNSRGEEAEDIYHSPTTFAMDTTVDITIHGRKEKTAKEDFNASIELIKKIESFTSRFESGSDVSKINSNAGTSPVKVEPETMVIIERATDMSRQLEGVFDLTIAPVANLWGFYDKKFRVPDSSEIENVLPLVDYKQISVDKMNGTVMLIKPGMKIDLGGVAKGYAVEQVCTLLRKRGVKSALVNFGGAVGAIGKRSDGESWVIGIKDPRGSAGDIIGELELTDSYVSSSGDYERYFEENGKRYFHIFDPRTGFNPHNVMAATVVGDTSLEADVLSTAIIVLGVDRSFEFLKNIGGFDAVIVDSKGKVTASPGMKKKYSLNVEDNI